MDYTIKIDDLSDPRIAQFLEEHLTDMRSTTPPESIHALDLNGLKQKEITFWSVWKNAELVACGALKQLTGDHAELKSMRTSAKYRGAGIGTMLLTNQTKGFPCEGISELLFVPGLRMLVIKGLQ